MSSLGNVEVAVGTEAQTAWAVETRRHDCRVGRELGGTLGRYLGRGESAQYHPGRRRGGDGCLERKTYARAIHLFSSSTGVKCAGRPTDLTRLQLLQYVPHTTSVQGPSSPPRAPCAGRAIQRGDRFLDRSHQRQEREVALVDDQQLAKCVDHPPPALTDQDHRLGRHQPHLAKIPGQSNLAEGAGAARQRDERVTLDQRFEALEECL